MGLSGQMNESFLFLLPELVLVPIDFQGLQHIK